MTEITLEAVESLAQNLVAEGAAARERLVRLIRAEAKILAAREPAKFSRKATEYRDEEGHYDNSYPPEQKYYAKTSAPLHRLLDRVTAQIPTERGCYYEWKMVTEFGGLYVDARGNLWTSDMTGTGHVGQFAAHPGDCGVECEIDWAEAGADEYTLAHLQEAESRLRAEAFPLSAAA